MTKQKPELEKLYNVAESAEWLCLKPSTIRKLIHRRQIAVRRPTKRAVRIAASELLRLQGQGASE